MSLRMRMSNAMWYCPIFGENSRRCAPVTVLFYIFLNMLPTRVCTDGSATVNIRKSVCTCVHVFTPQKSGPLSLRKFKQVVMSVKRSLEFEIEISARKTKIALEKRRIVL